MLRGHFGLYISDTMISNVECHPPTSEPTTMPIIPLVINLAWLRFKQQFKMNLIYMWCLGHNKPGFGHSPHWTVNSGRGCTNIKSMCHIFFVNNHPEIMGPLLGSTCRIAQVFHPSANCCMYLSGIKNCRHVFLPRNSGSRGNIMVI